MERVIRTQREKSERSARQQRRHELTGTSQRTASATESVDIVLSYGGDLKKFSSWNNVIEVDLFSIEASDKGNHNDVCAKEDLLKYRTCSLNTQFTLPSQNVSVIFFFDQVLGDISRNGLLNDAIINMCMQEVCDLRHGCKLLNY
ncbi:hypothetical protein GN958_ATG07039, partial [Phytophthora infestans]